MVTPSAISHCIEALEDRLGRPLFVRTNRGLTLTAAGATYLLYVSRALSMLTLGLDRIPDLSTGGQIRLSVVPAFAARWLLPRLHEFLERRADVDVRLDTTPATMLDIPADGVDIAIRRVAGP